LIPAVAISARVVEDEEYNSNWIEMMDARLQSLLNQQQEHVITTAAATA
jgi:pheromone shutdown protein TraB